MNIFVCYLIIPGQDKLINICFLGVTMKREKNGTTQAKENIEENEMTGKNIRKKETTASIDLQNIEVIMKTMIEVISGIEGKRIENGN